jgi:LacI family transcriptional regulator
MVMKCEVSLSNIKDVAKLAGVSTATVSHVINKSRFVSEETANLVANAIKKLEYRPNTLARGLRSRKTKTLGLIVPDSTNLFFAEIAQVIENAAYEKGYHIILCNTGNDAKKEMEQIDVLLAKQVDGVVLISSGLVNSSLARLEITQTPFVVVDREIPDLDGYFVLIDNYLGGYLATKHLLDLGHRHIACITGPKRISTSSRRVEGFHQALLEMGLSESIILEGDFSISSGTQAMDKILSFSEPPTAVFVCNDMMAVGAMMSALSHGLKIPDDLSIVGFDDIQLSESLCPGLTTIRHPYNEIGNSTINLFLEQINEESRQKNGHSKRIILTPELVIRASTRAVGEIKQMQSVQVDH